MGFLGSAKSAVKFAPFGTIGRFVPDSRAKGFCLCCETNLLAWEVCSFSRKPDLFDVRRYADTPQDVVCPVCGSIPRHRIIVWHLCQRPELVEGKSVLHFAPERGLLLWLRRHGASVTPADLLAPADLQLDLQDIDLPDSSYDVIVCNHVLEHVEDYRRALSELYRVLRSGGLLICSFPIDSRYETVYEDSSIITEADRIACFGQHDHLRIFGSDSDQMLEGIGFTVELARGVDCPDIIRPVTGPADYDSPDIFFCWKAGERAIRPS